MNIFKEKLINENLNTTNVSVQFQTTPIAKYGSPYLNTTNVSVQCTIIVLHHATKKFKYNKCIGSMKIEWEFADLSIFSTPHFIAVSCFFSS